MEKHDDNNRKMRKQNKENKLGSVGGEDKEIMSKDWMAKQIYEERMNGLKGRVTKSHISKKWWDPQKQS